MLKKLINRFLIIFKWTWYILGVLLHIILILAAEIGGIGFWATLVILLIWYIPNIVRYSVKQHIKKKNQAKVKARTIVINDVLGEFSIDPILEEYFQGKIKWCDEENCDVYLERDSGDSVTVFKSLEILHKLCENMQHWNLRLKEFSADDKYITDDGLIEIWGSPYGNEESDKPNLVTKAEYINRISVTSISISINGDLFFMCDLDEMFTDHCEVITANISGEILETALWG